MYHLTMDQEIKNANALESIKKIVNSAPTDFDFNSLISNNESLFSVDYTNVEGVIEVREKNIGIIHHSWIHNKIRFVFFDCKINKIVPTSTYTQFYYCTIKVIEVNSSPSNIFIFAGTLTSLELSSQFFEEAQFFHTKIGVFSTTVTPVTLSDVTFGRVTFAHISDFKKVKLGTNVHFDSSSFTLTGTDKFESEFRHMKKEASEHKNETLANFFASWEVKSRYTKQYPLDNPYEKVFGFLFWLLNDFGLRPYLPLLYIFGISGLIILFDSTVYSNHNAFVFLITPLKILNKDIVYKCYSIYTQSLLNLIGATLWFFTILGLRKTFKVDKI